MSKFSKNPLIFKNRLSQMSSKMFSKNLYTTPTTLRINSKRKTFSSLNRLSRTVFVKFKKNLMIRKWLTICQSLSKNVLTKAL